MSHGYHIFDSHMNKTWKTHQDDMDLKVWIRGNAGQTHPLRKGYMDLYVISGGQTWMSAVGL